MDNQPSSQNIGLGLSLGTAIGVALGVAFDNIAMGLALGISLGLIFGSMPTEKISDEKAKVEPPKENIKPLLRKKQVRNKSK